MTRPCLKHTLLTATSVGAVAWALSVSLDGRATSCDVHWRPEPAGEALVRSKRPWPSRRTHDRMSTRLKSAPPARTVEALPTSGSLIDRNGLPSPGMEYSVLTKPSGWVRLGATDARGRWYVPRRYLSTAYDPERRSSTKVSFVARSGKRTLYFIDNYRANQQLELRTNQELRR